LEKFKKKEQQEYQVDRRIINKFLVVNYLNQQSSSSIEEKQQLGLVKR
jgi:hypothetical protein